MTIFTFHCQQLDYQIINIVGFISDSVILLIFMRDSICYFRICYFRDFTHSFSHSNNTLFLGYNDIYAYKFSHLFGYVQARLGTLVDDDTDGDRRTLISFKVYDSDSSYGGLIAPSNVMLKYTIKLEGTFLSILATSKKLPVSVMISYNFSKAFNLISLATLWKKISHAIYHTTDILLSEVCKQRAEVTRKEW